MRALAAAISLGLVGAAPAPAATPGAPTELQRRIALAALPTAASAEEVFSTGGVGSSSVIASARSGRDILARWDGKAPRWSTLLELRDMLDSSAMSCPKVRAAAQRRGEVRADSEAVRHLGGLRASSQPNVAYRISLPAVSADAAEAVIAVSVISSQLSGGGYLIHLQGEGGQWKIAGRRW